MTVVGKGFEQEAIDSITLLLSNIKSSNGLMEVKKALVRHEQFILEEELEIANKKVNALQKRIKILGGNSEEEEEEKKEEEAESLEKKPYQDNRPVFSTPRFERIIMTNFKRSDLGANNFTVNDLKLYLAKNMNISLDHYTYLTDKGSNLFEACIRNTIRSMTQRNLLKRVRSGVFTFSELTHKIDLKKDGLVNWVVEEV